VRDILHQTYVHVIEDKKREIIYKSLYLNHLGYGTMSVGRLVGKLEGWSPVGRSRCRWEHNIKVDLTEVG
jgi:hypothetical protein